MTDNDHTTSKPCLLCGVVKPLEMFGIDARRPDRRRTRCKACHMEYMKLHRETETHKSYLERKKARQRTPEYKANMKVRQRSEASKARKREADNSDAAKERRRRYRETEKYQEYFRKYRDGLLGYESFRSCQLRRKYGIGLSDYETMLASQGGRCAICGTTEPGGPWGKYLLVDHDHETGCVRGLLCNRCNSAMGLFGDDPELLSMAVDYLRKNQ